ncbi:MarR family winged helix-turn-helix transcriptional regulator [Flavobacterium beibuense]|uniref:MarR family transcriptional regulator n=1 Tax=Flavobacterium beibuense TaxID=657326 RepID=A0A444WBG3_9FLAO|nr:MarR family transcriptional regulator [Flavobacterium beibuense]RYJ43171.1 MarR family transcriptional regulator [Flavobacterium beibuense]
MDITENALKVRKLSQQFAYTSIQMHENIGRKIGLSGTDHKYLGFLIQKGEMTAGELSVLTGLTTGAVTGLIDRFENKKLVKRKADKHDRRKIIIVPNHDKIINLITPFYQDFQDNTDKLFTTFSDSELKTLEKYFENAMKIMNEKIDQLNK